MTGSDRNGVSCWHAACDTCHDSLVSFTFRQLICGTRETQEGEDMDGVWFEVLGPIKDIRVIARGRRIRKLQVLKRRYGEGPSRKMKGHAFVRFSDGRILYAEVHWYEAHGIGRRNMKIKNVLE